MSADRTVEILATALHTAWCEQMKREGWRRGERFDAATMQHDGLVPFEQLHKVDRRDALTSAEILFERIASVYELYRGPDEEFSALNVHKGQRVRLKRGRTVEGVAPDAEGEIIGWEPEDDEILVAVTVRWPGGVTSEHPPAERDLTRVGPERR